MRPLDTYIKTQLDSHLNAIGQSLDADMLAIFSPIVPGLDLRVRAAVECLHDRKRKSAIVLDTVGGIVHSKEYF